MIIGGLILVGVALWFLIGIEGGLYWENRRWGSKPTEKSTFRAIGRSWLGVFAWIFGYFKYRK